ncbi:MAG TPA: hypothetical protein VL053_09515 [Arachidicoccus sp.]|nr:hypothetical protein [Arachidicoccus sp.]
MIKGVNEIKHQVESFLYRMYGGKDVPPRLDNISFRTKTESAKNYYVPIFIGSPTIRKGKYWYSGEVDSEYLKRLIDNGHLFSLHDLEIESLDQQTFFSGHNFSRLAKYAWWTFSKEFLKELELAVQCLPIHLLPEFIETLSKYKSPYLIEDTDQEDRLEPESVKFARVKKLHWFKIHDEYVQIELKDKDNRKKILSFLRRRKRVLKNEGNQSFRKMKDTVIYRDFSDLFIDALWQEKFDFVLSLLRSKYNSTGENGSWLIDELRAKGKAPENGHFQLFFITNKFLQMGAFKQTELTLSEICQKLYFSLRIDLDKSKFSKYYYQILNESAFSGKQNVLVEEMDSFLSKANLL